MLHKTKAIVLSSIPYSESNIISKLFTEQAGLETYMVRGVRKHNDRTKAAHFQPLRVIEIETQGNKKSSLQTVRTSCQLLNSDGINCDIVKTSIAIFMSEVINLSIREETVNRPLFDFLLDSIRQLEQADSKRLAEFHIRFLIDFASKLGFSPMDNYNEQQTVFNPVSGCFVSQSQAKECFSVEQSRLLHAFLGKESHSSVNVCSSRAERNMLLDGLVLFYRIHITNNREIKSRNVLSTILH